MLDKRDLEEIDRILKKALKDAFKDFILHFEYDKKLREKALKRLQSY